jgi:uncharacterized membrane protein YfcA
LLAGLARGFSGFGAALIFVPLASAALGPQTATPLLLLVDTFTTLPMVRPAWRLAARRETMVMAVGTIMGVPLGVLLLKQLDPAALRWGICGLATAMLVLLVSGWRYRGDSPAWLSVVVGAMAGFFSGAAQLGGPPVVAYWLGSAGPAARVRANIVLYFAWSSIITGTAYLVSGLLGVSLLVLTATIAPVYGLGVWTGSRLFGLMSDEHFRRVCLGLIALAALLGLPLWDRLR